jgi:hypothetical protein
MERFLGVSLLLLVSGMANAQWIPPNPVTSAERRADRVVFRLKNGFLTLARAQRFDCPRDLRARGIGFRAGRSHDYEKT